MSSYFKSILLFSTILFIGCESNPHPFGSTSSECTVSNKEIIIGEWKNPTFPAEGDDCHFGECLEIKFNLHTDGTYDIAYSVTQSNEIIRSLDDKGTYEFDCSEMRLNSGGGNGDYRHMFGTIILNSEEFEKKEWAIEWISFKGLYISPEHLGYPEDATFTLGK